jgi:hypothetical protein
MRYFKIIFYFFAFYFLTSNLVFAKKVKVISVPKKDTVSPILPDNDWSEVEKNARDPLKGNLIYTASEGDLKRYRAHPEYGKLGFNPFRDNEDYYNKNSTPGTDFIRALKRLMIFPLIASLCFAIFVFFLTKYLRARGKI